MDEERCFVDILRWYGMRDVNYLRARINAQNYAFHDTDISVAEPEIGC